MSVDIKTTTITKEQFPNLYHGSNQRLPHHFPNLFANWFATEKTQASLYPLMKDKSERRYVQGVFVPSIVRVYTYEIVHPIPDIYVLDSAEDMNKLATYLDVPKVQKLFTVYDKDIVEALCEKGLNGWMLLRDQSQIMLCHPEQFLKPVALEELQYPIKMLAHDIYYGELKKIQEEMMKVESQLYRELLSANSEKQKEISDNILKTITSNKKIQKDLKEVEKSLEKIRKVRKSEIERNNNRFVLIGHDTRPYHTTKLD